ncbi:SMP-30/gluconolactonase/LRE family protein [Sphingobacterium hungaricum]|uniref:Gluconolactonase n=1 Tax=Sphingobacterium hungaricum TaxID=2082723 RepID=A0A928YS16_9SPHI|nr:SMP-30/gluconolactonase/LRE family protein [Sphingobacterium hungaricum]MBE8715544.1 gluconolactonase [Sphingobacterium hungaricum]
MIVRNFMLCLFTVICFTAGAQLQKNSSVIADGAELLEISSQFSFTEGPAIDQEGNVYFTDQPNNKIWLYDNQGNLSLFMDNAGRANGMFFDAKGNLYACADEKNELWIIDSKTKVKTLVNAFENNPLNGPNDVWVSKSGFIYFTDPYYQRDYWTRTNPEIKHEGLYLLTKKGKLQLLDKEFKRPNGLVGTPDGKFLYVADINDHKTYRYTILADGTLSDKTLFVNQGSDGMTIDHQGNIYLTGNGVTVYNPKGEKIEHIEVPAKWTANVSFYGKDRDQLFITASEKIFTLKMKVKDAR